MVVNIQENNATAVTRIYVDYDSLLIFVDESNSFCDAIVERRCYVRSPLKVVVPAKDFGAGTVVRINLSTPYRRTSTSATTDPLLFCTALSKRNADLATIALCMKTVLAAASLSSTAAEVNKWPETKSLYVDVAVNSIFKYPTSKEKHFTKRVFLCLLLIFVVIIYYIVVYLFNKR